MKTKYSIIALAVLLLSQSEAFAWPPGGFGPGWSFSRVPGGRAWRTIPGNGVFAGDVALTYDANKDGKITAKDKNKAYLPLKTRTPGMSLWGKNLLRLGFEATAILPAPHPNNHRQPGFQDYKTIASLEISGINLLARSGKFVSFEEEYNACGRVKVWLDASRTRLLLDSGDYRHRRVEWLLAEGPVPAYIYVETTAPGRAGSAFRLTASVDDSNQNIILDDVLGRKTAYDHIILNAVPGYSSVISSYGAK
jgi:hypothetical protein